MFEFFFLKYNHIFINPLISFQIHSSSCSNNTSSNVCQRQSTRPANQKTPKINRRHSVNFDFDAQITKPLANSKSEIKNSQFEPFILSFSDLLSKAKPIQSNFKIALNNFNTNELVLDNLFDKNSITAGNIRPQTPPDFSPKFNTDFYKLCSDTFLNESNYALTQQQQHSQNPHQSLSVDHFHVSYQV